MEAQYFFLNQTRELHAHSTWYIPRNYYTNFNSASLGATTCYKPWNIDVYGLFNLAVRGLKPLAPLFWVSLMKTRNINIYVFTLKISVHIGSNKYLYTGGNFQFYWKFSIRIKKYLLHTAKNTAKCPTAKMSYDEISHGEISLRRTVLTVKCPTVKCTTAKNPTAKCLVTLS